MSADDDALGGIATQGELEISVIEYHRGHNRLLLSLRKPGSKENPLIVVVSDCEKLSINPSAPQLAAIDRGTEQVRILGNDVDIIGREIRVLKPPHGGVNKFLAFRTIEAVLGAVLARIEAAPRDAGLLLSELKCAVALLSDVDRDTFDEAVDQLSLLADRFHLSDVHKLVQVLRVRVGIFR
jgi:hypothetical protein